MTEKIQIKGHDVWIVIDPHQSQATDGAAEEYFTASYHATDPASEPAGVIFLDKNHRPVIFNSPVQALEYASEQLLGLY